MKIIWIFSLLLASCTAAPVTTAPTPTNPTLPNPTGTTAATVTPAPTLTETLVPLSLPVLESPQLAYIDMQDSRQGWGIAVNGSGGIVRTVDGGQTWFNATPAKAGEIGRSTALFVLDEVHAWAVVPGVDFYASTLYQTADGGVHWKTNPVPFGGAEIQFLDASTGRALADRGAGAGSNAVGLYQTADGGVTWTSVFHNDPTEPGSSDSLPLSGIKNGMTFLNPREGWVSGSVPVTGNVYLYATHDGGVSWTQAEIPLPFGYEQAMTMAHGPIFFGQEGLLPVTLYMPDSTALIFYFSHDSGASWSADRQSPVWPGRYSFADALHGWVWDGNQPVRMSADGGLTWQDLPISLKLEGTLNQIQFAANGAGGFTGWALSSLDEKDHSTLYTTTDNGSTWMPLNP